MSLVVAFNEIDPARIRIRDGNGGPGSKNIPYFRPTADKPDGPTAFIAKYDPGRTLASHFHIVDQFQILIEGEGTFGRHNVSPYCVHFSRAYTPYGPLLADTKKGWAFMTLRTRFDPGAQHLPAAQEKLKQVAGRQPWQITKKVAFPVQNTGVSLQQVPDISDDQGLFTYSLAMAPNTRTTAPDPSRGDGQYVIVVKGSVIHDNKERQAPTVMFVKPNEGPLQLEAGAQGMQALVLNFPQVNNSRAADAKVPSIAAGFKKWQCVLCSFAYDEALGMPAEGIPAGTRWEHVPETWSCPDCSASKSDFDMVEVA